ncbi:branched-chain amino acid ABC transporter permease [Marinibaculum pumilum]|uniref:Branched-chain amino acid ABC transporter permease n=1 Tax=Marinibaculum pumilum TaxID=1766165 RepID=A0ABV7L474_9PROT
MSQAIQILVDALSVGALYALSALGIGLIFGIMRLINFAHGEFIALGAYLLMVMGGLWVPLAIVLMVAAIAVLAMSTERIAFRPVRNADPATMLVTSFAVSFLLQNLYRLIWGSRPLGFDFLSILGTPLLIGEVRIPTLQLMTLGVTVLLLVALVLFLTRTHFGIEMRAAAVNFRMSRLLGVRADRVISVAFAMSGVLAAAVAAMHLSQTGSLTPVMGLQLALVGFVSTIVGGMGSLPGAVLGGFFIGIVTVLLQSALPLDLRPYRDAFVFGIVILVLLVRPQGLFLSAQVRERI